MDANSVSQAWQWPESPIIDPIDDRRACMLCLRNISHENQAARDFSVFNLCHDCHLTIREPLETRRQRRTVRRVSTPVSYENLDISDNIFSRNVTDVMNTRIQAPLNVSLRGDQPFSHESAAMQPQRGSSRTTPNGSRRWLRVPSDTESLELDSVYAGSESNFSVGGSRNFQSEIDAGSFSAYGAESDISVDGRSFIDTDFFPQIGFGSEFDSDTDIDPMHAGGLHQWDSDDDDWETDNESNLVETNEESQSSDFVFSRLSERNGNITLRRTSEGVVNLRIMEYRESYISNILASLEESNLTSRVDSIEDYMEVAEFEAFLDRVAGSETSRQGAPPAAESFLKNLPRLVIAEEHRREQYDLACAICKDQMLIGNEVNQLPCSHMYHPYCIMPWLGVRNSCPLCRFELPTDDLEYEEKKQGNNNLEQAQQQYITDDNSSHITVDTDSPPTDSNLLLQAATPEAYPDADVNQYSIENRRGWLYIAGPIVSIVGIALVFWLGNPLSSRRAELSPRNLQAQNQLLTFHTITPPNNRGHNQRSWWSLF